MKEIQVQCQQSYEVLSLLGFTFDELSKVLYVVNKELDIVKYQYTNKTLNIVSTFKLSEQVCNDSEILSFQYLMENDSLILVFKNGQIVKVQKEEAEVVGQFDCGVLAAAWNPNQEQLIVLCADGKLVSFDAQLEPTKEITIDLIEQPAAISFKNDGKFFSLNYSVTNGRLCQTYDVQLEKFQSSSKSDPEGGLVQAIFERPRKMQNTVAWQPNNGFIGGIEGQQVIFWEKNGLRHLEFDLFEEGQELLWSPDGVILAVKHSNKIGLYLRQNYKWYCKQMFNFEKVIGFTFIETNTLVVFTEGFMFFYWLNYQYNNTSIGLSTNQNKLLVTNYKKGVVPPPMCHYELQVESQINLVYYQQYIYIYTLSGILYIFNDEKLVGKVSVNIQNAHKLICYTDSDVVFGHAVFVVHEEGRDQIADVVISPEFEVINIWRKEFSQPTQISAITITNHQVLLHSRFGEKFIYDQSKEECLAEFDLANWEQNVYDVKIQQHGESLACLKSNAKLMLNNQLITGDCTSFAFFDHFLAFTLNTTDLFHNLYILDLNKPLQIDKKSLNISNIERGAKILAIVGLDRLIVQVPRGNLETTAPRVMVLHLCKQLHDQKRYKECFEAIRKHKLDMNLMFDFTGDIDPLIVEQLSEQYLQLFIQSLNNTVSFELPYVLTSEQYKHIQAQIIDRTLGSTKINYVCQKLIDNMKEDTHILTIVTAMLKKEPSEVEEALLKTLTLKQNEQHQEEEIPPHLNPDTLKPYKKHHKIKSEQVLEYICWLADANKMFEVALGTYDFDLVKQVAQFTQKDPKEYLPMLERYANIKDPVDMKSTIHLELKNYDKAIRVLATGNEEQKRKSIEIIRKQSRFRVALEVYRDDATIIKQVKEALGDYLIEQKQHHQASLAYESAGLFEKAVKASIEILDTKRILSFEPTSEQLVVYQESLLSAGRWKDCGEVQEYLKNYEQAIHYYCKAEEWDKVALCLRHNHIQIDDHLQLAYSLKVNHMLNQEHLFVQKFERLRIVQEQKKEHGILAPTQLQADFDQISDVSGKSGVSKSSYTMSVTTGVRKRKPKEKSFLTRNIKPGSPVEEEYLVEFLRDIQNKSGEVISSVKKFQNYLIYFNRPKLSQDLSIRAKEYLKTMKPEIKSLAQLQFEEKNPEAIDLYQKVQGTVEFTQLLDDLIK